MSFVALACDLERERAEALSDALIEAGALSVSLDDPAALTDAETPLFDEPGETIALWPVTRLTALFAAEAPAQVLFEQTWHDLGYGAPPDLAISYVGDEDWVRLTQSQFPPIEITPRLWVVPSWHTPPVADAMVIRLDPGAAFGTGSHATTRLCLRWLAQHLRAGERVLDYGCGSGILAIAAAKLGAREVVGVDIDEHALQAARANALTNEVRARFTDARDSREVGQFEVIVANILTNPLKLLAPALAAHGAPRGRIALSGVLAQQADEVIATYARWFDAQVWREDEGWVFIEGSRRDTAS